MLNKYGWNSKWSFNGGPGQKSSDQGRVLTDVPHILLFSSSSSAVHCCNGDYGPLPVSVVGSA